MKITVPGKTPLERLTEFTRRIVAVPKSEAIETDKKLRTKTRRKRRRLQSINEAQE